MLIEGLEAAWAFFEGVPKYLVIDNFPAAVAGVDPLHPRLNYARLSGVLPAPGLHRRPGAGAPST